jgi:hypothetical protein
LINLEFAGTVILLWIAITYFWSLVASRQLTAEESDFDMTVEMSRSRSLGYRLLACGFFAVAIALAIFALGGAL